MIVNDWDFWFSNQYARQINVFMWPTFCILCVLCYVHVFVDAGKAPKATGSLYGRCQLIITDLLHLPHYSKITVLKYTPVYTSTPLESTKFSYPSYFSY